MAMIACRQGYSVVLLERGQHPRFTIGESSTPLANLLLEELATRYDLPSIRPLTKWGSWQRTYPEIACGLKRGFTFYHHQLGVEDQPDPDHQHQLLVAASPHDRIADTHWYRAEFDTFFLEQAQSLGADYIDQVTLSDFQEHLDCVTFNAIRQSQSNRYQASFAIDATGPHGFLSNQLKLPDASLPGYPATQALYSHFSGVTLPGVPSSSFATNQMPPYPPEAAAVHHLFQGGWVWVLRFNNGMTSAGVVATDHVAQHLGLSEAEPAWHRLLGLLPTLKRQFKSARAEQPFIFASRLASLSIQTCGLRWAMLPSTVGFVDPLLSTGFPLTLLGISRLANILELKRDVTLLHGELATYAAQTTGELVATSRLIASLYANMHNFPVFRALSLLYFAAASYSESAMRLGKPHLAQSFLLHDHPVFGASSKAIFERAIQPFSPEEQEQLIRDINAAIQPFDVAGLTDPAKRNWYPVDATQLLDGAYKVHSTREQVEALLLASGFHQS